MRRQCRIQPDAVVDDQHAQLTVPGADVDADGPRLRVPHAVGHRLLDDAVDAGAVLVRQRVEVAVDLELDVDRVAAREVADVPFERGLQAEVVEHAGPQAEREVADGAEHVVDERLALGEPGADAASALSRSMRPSSIRRPVSTWAT